MQARIRGVVSLVIVQLGSAPRESKNSTASVQSAVMACISAVFKSVSGGFLFQDQCLLLSDS